ncbi:hypothetical protein PENFLA_c007G07665 [Penicillium flavigenum]|uniref:Mid2 domain-containing protein n=1 Tax=Penicillium flavigenum TaxID=254877 RepID=A0A1V6TKR3_9EURO|nr:hypothetical protein PENFLA_c007G07665 [Penicillium flavigenum]
MFCASFLAILALQVSRALAVTTTIPPNIQGYHWDSKDSTWSDVACYPGQTYVSSSSFARCCSHITSSGCVFPTNCAGNKVLFDDGGTADGSCDKGSYCAFMTIYESATTDPGVTDYFCWTNSNPWIASTVFRTTDAVTATPRTSPTPSTATATTRTSVAPTPVSTEDTTQGSESSGSKAWIAGAVVGPVAGCAIIAALAFWCIRRSRAKKQGTVSGNEAFMPPTSMAANTPGAQFVVPSELDGARKPHELDGGHSTSELPAPVEPANKIR